MRCILRPIVAAILGLIALAPPVVSQTAQDRPFVRVTHLPGTQALPILVGIERGFFAREGITISPTASLDQTAAVNALANGFTDFVIGPQSWLLDMAHSKAEAKVVALDGYGRELEMIVPAWDTTTKDVASLKGKLILFAGGTHNFDSVPELYRVLALSKMRLSDVQIDFFQLNNLASALDPKARPGWQNRKIGAILTFREYTARYVRDKKARALLTNEQIASMIGRIGARPVFASTTVLKTSPGSVQRFVTAWVKTLDYIEKNKDDSAQLLSIYFARQFGVPLNKDDAALFVSLIKYDRAAWTDDDIKEININGQAISAARNLLFASIKDPAKRPFQTAPDVTAYFDDSFVKKAVAALEEEKKKRAAAPPPPAPPKAGEPEKKPEGEKKAEGEDKPKSN